MDQALPAKKFPEPFHPFPGLWKWSVALILINGITYFALWQSGDASRLAPWKGILLVLMLGLLVPGAVVGWVLFQEKFGYRLSVSVVLPLAGFLLMGIPVSIGMFYLKSAVGNAPSENWEAVDLAKAEIGWRWITAAGAIIDFVAAGAAVVAILGWSYYVRRRRSADPESGLLRTEQ